MESLQQFLGGVGLVIVAGVIFSAAERQQVNFGSVADWAGALANFLVVCVTLWLALSERRKKRDARRRSREALLSAIDNLLALRRYIFEAYGNGAFPEMLERKSFSYHLAGTMRTWERVHLAALADFDQAIAADADAPFQELWQAISVMLAQPATNEVINRQFEALIAAGGTLEDMRRLLK